MLWKKIKKIPFKNVGSCLKKVRKNSIISPWIEDIFSKKLNINYESYKNCDVRTFKIKLLIR